MFENKYYLFDEEENKTKHQLFREWNFPVIKKNEIIVVVATLDESNISIFGNNRLAEHEWTVVNLPPNYLFIFFD